MILSLLCVACHSNRKNVRPQPGTAVKKEKFDIATVREPQARGLIEECMRWLGTPYRYGGAERGKGTDCSGFVYTVFLEHAGIKLPRDSRSQQKFCKGISAKNLSPADLVFFASKAGGDRVGHVGIYLGDNQFIHASTSRGVIISDLGQDYYVRHYHSAGRVPGMKESKKSTPKVLPLPMPEPEELVVPDTIVPLTPDSVTIFQPLEADTLARADSIRNSVRARFMKF